MLPYLLIATSTLLSEDLACIAAGALISQGKLDWLGAILACAAGIFFGDLGLVVAGYLAGPKILRWRVIRRWIPDQRVRAASDWITRRGISVILISRFTPGLRLPTYLAAGLLHANLLRVAMYMLISSLLWTPVAVGASALLGGEAIRMILSHTGSLAPAILLLILLVIVLRRFGRAMATKRSRRLLYGRLKRMTKWEFWPASRIYLPLAPYFLYLSVKHRSPTLFTAANPGIPSSGFDGESKSQILDHLSACPERVPAHRLIRMAPGLEQRIESALDFVRSNPPGYPIIAKPDMGERGLDVAVVRSDEELRAYLASARLDTILQQYVSGVEFGVSYYRFPDEGRGHIFSITEKKFPFLTGDGKRTLEELILDDSRAVCIAERYIRENQAIVDTVPAPGERVQLVQYGSHTRGSVFLDATALKTPELEAEIDRVSRFHPGFYLGRFDVRTPSVEAFQKGEFTVLELNGITGEATHIYDPAVSLWDAYRALAMTWRLAYEIGAANQGRGDSPIGLSVFLRLVWRRYRGGAPAVSTI